MLDAFFDVSVFNPLVSSNRNTTIPALFKANEHIKRSYEQRVIDGPLPLLSLLPLKGWAQLLQPSTRNWPA